MKRSLAEETPTGDVVEEKEDTQGGALLVLGWYGTRLKIAQDITMVVCRHKGRVTNVYTLQHNCTFKMNVTSSNLSKGELAE